MKQLFTISIATSFILALSGCQVEKDLTSVPNYHVITARMGDAGTRAIMQEIPNSLNLTTKWQGHEYINVFYMMTDSYNETSPKVQVSEITDDGFGATFSYKVPEEWDKSDVYDVKLFTSPCFPKLQDGKVYYNASIIREPISEFQIPVYSEGKINAEGKLNATFHHYFTYELLHIYNTSESDIEFSLHGFEGTPWYKEKGSLCIDDGSFVVDAPSTKQPHRESNPITIKPGESQIIVSAYIPNGGTINEARMVAKINGEITYSVNTKTSGIELKQGRAYHMYAGWDGEELKFWKDGEEPLDVKTLNASINSKVISGSFSGTVSNKSIEGLETGFRFWKDEPEDYVEYKATPGADNTFTLTLAYNDFVEIANNSPVKGLYKVSAFVIDANKNYYHGDILEFTIDKDQPEWPTEPTEGDLIDMGLSVKWASCNVGASNPQGVGGFFAWGETEEKTEYTWANYELSNGSETSIKKYCTESTYGIVDNRVKLELSDDVAYVDSQGKMRMPTTEEWQELLDKCHWSRTTYEGQVGYLYASPFTGNAIFIPTNGIKYNSAWVNHDSAYYWSSDLSSEASKSAVSFHGNNILKWNRQEGIGVRAVSDSKDEPIIDVNPTLLEFGKVAVGSSVSKNVTVSNIGNGVLTFHLAGDGWFTYTPSDEVTLEKGQSCEVIITFSPQSVSHTGSVLRVFSNAGTKYIECEGEGVESSVYPTSSYRLSDDGKTLVRWLGTETEIDMTLDPAFDEVINIGEEAFSNNGTMTSLKLSKNVEEIRKFAFFYCTKLKTIVFPKSIRRIKDLAFDDCRYIQNVHITDLSSWCSLTVGRADPFDGVLFDSATLYLNGVEVKELVIPDDVTRIEKRVLGGFSFTKVTIPRNVESIGFRAFESCPNLRSLIIEEGVKTIEGYAFSHCGMEEVVLPNSITDIGSYAFAYCADLTSLVFPPSISYVGENAFWSCTNLDSVHISDFARWCETEFIGNPLDSHFETEDGEKSSPHLFLNGRELKGDIVIPNGVKTIGSGAFEGFQFVSSFTVPNSVTTIKGAAFRESSMTHISIPNSVLEIGSQAFMETPLEGIVIPGSIKELTYGLFERCTQLQSVELPDSIQAIDAHAFSQCESLRMIVIPDSVESISICCFEDCLELETIEIGRGVKRIGCRCFKNCESLKTIISHAETPPEQFSKWGVSGSVFDESTCLNAHLFVPQHCEEAYQGSNLWGAFKQISSYSTNNQ